MRIRFWSYFCVFAISIWLIIIVMANSYKSHNKPDYSGRAGYVLTDVQATSYALAIHLRDLEPSDLKLSRREIVNLSKRLALKYLDEFSNRRGIHVLPDGGILDDWGNPLRIKITLSGSSTPVITLRVWSIGENGVDENGNGDDVSAKEIVIRWQ